MNITNLHITFNPNLLDINTVEFLTPDTDIFLLNYLE